MLIRPVGPFVGRELEGRSLTLVIRRPLALLQADTRLRHAPEILSMVYCSKLQQQQQAAAAVVAKAVVAAAAAVEEAPAAMVAVCSSASRGGVGSSIASTKVSVPAVERARQPWQS